MTSLGGCDLTPPTDLLSVSPPPVAIVRLQTLHTAAVRLAKEAPEIIANPQAAYGLEQALLEAMIDCLSKGAVEEDRVAQRQHRLCHVAGQRSGRCTG